MSDEVTEMCGDMLKQFKTSWDGIKSNKCSSNKDIDRSILDSIKREMSSMGKTIPIVFVVITLGLMIISIVQKASVDKALPDSNTSEAATNTRNTTNIVLFVCITVFVLACINLFLAMRK